MDNKKRTAKELEIFAILRGEKELTAPKPVRKPTTADKNRAKKYLQKITSELKGLDKTRADLFNDLQPLRVDSKGRIYFKEFFITVKKAGLMVGPHKDLVLRHPEIKWDFHAGWDNKYSTILSLETIKGFLKEAV